MATAGIGDRGQRGAGAVAPNLGRVQPDVELREVEPEDLDAPPEIGQTAVGDPGSPIRPQAAVENGEIGGELVRRAVAAVSEPPPDEGELAPVGLAFVLRPDLGRVV